MMQVMFYSSTAQQTACDRCGPQFSLGSCMEVSWDTTLIAGRTVRGSYRSKLANNSSLFQDAAKDRVPRRFSLVDCLAVRQDDLDQHTRSRRTLRTVPLRLAGSMASRSERPPIAWSFKEPTTLRKHDGGTISLFVVLLASLKLLLLELDTNCWVSAALDGRQPSMGDLPCGRLQDSHCSLTVLMVWLLKVGCSPTASLGDRNPQENVKAS